MTTKCWRERITEARDRGHFSVADHSAWVNVYTCPVGEVAARFGVQYQALDYAEPFKGHWGAQTPIYWALLNHDVEGMAQMLDQLEDAALVLKREATDG